MVELCPAESKPIAQMYLMAVPYLEYSTSPCRVNRIEGLQALRFGGGKKRKKSVTRQPSKKRKDSNLYIFTF